MSIKYFVSPLDKQNKQLRIMENQKHTKGEWIAELANVQTENRVIANCIGNGASITKEDRANAQLISASPDFLVALVKLKESHAKLYSLLTLNAKNELIDYEKFPSVLLANIAIEKATKND